jgi:lysozyme
MNISNAGLALIKTAEGFESHLYTCPAGDATIGYGHLVHHGPVGGAASEAPFVGGVDEQRATDLLRQDVAYAEHAVTTLVKVTVTQGQFDALVSFTYNLGAGTLQRSTLLRMVNAGRFDFAADQFLAWDHAGGVVVPGLTRRREAERKMFA